jgi:hypothetical protein
MMRSTLCLPSLLESDLPEFGARRQGVIGFPIRARRMICVDQSVRLGAGSSSELVSVPFGALLLLGLATTQKYLEPSKETEKQLEAMKLPL